jgi:predicted RNA-binding Zn-ribbon protein involved in translation (DUF1610 family)
MAEKMTGTERLELALKTLYVCPSCGVTMFGHSIPGGTVVARIGAQGLIEFTCPKCRGGMLEPVVSDVPPQNWRSTSKGP